MDRQTVKECMRAIDAKIVQGDIPGNGLDRTAQRNGMILAYNILMEMLTALDKQESER